MLAIVNDMCLNTDNKVVLSNDLIKGKSNLSLNEIKLLRLAIMQVVKEDADLKTYRVRLIELANTLNIDVHGIYAEIDKITDNLMREFVYIGDGNPKHGWKKFHWCSSCQYEDTSGTLIIKLHDDLKPYLIGLSKQYTQYMLADVLMLKSVYSIRIYELIKQAIRYSDIYGELEADVILKADLIREATGTEGKYTKHSMFKARVIEAAIDEINNKLGYYITYEPIKYGRKVDAYKFHIQSKYKPR